MAKIAGYGVSIPQCRITVEEIFDMWPYAYPPDSIKALMGLAERAVNRTDEDPVTMGAEASKAALEMSGVCAKAVDGIFFGSFTNPYVTKSSGIIVSEIVGLRQGDIRCADLQYGGKSGSVALDIAATMVKAGDLSWALAVGADSVSRHCRPNTVQEYSAGAGGAAFLVGKEGFVNIDGLATYNTDTADFFRVDGDRYLNPGFAEEEESSGYEAHAMKAASLYFEKTGTKAADFKYLAVSQLSGRRTRSLAKALGFQDAAVDPGMTVAEIGYAGSASALVSLCKILDMSSPGDRILVVSYGYGAGCDVIGLTVEKGIVEARERRKEWPNVDSSLRNKILVDYKTYAKLERKIIHEYV